MSIRRKLLDDEIESLLQELKKIEPGTDEYFKVSSRMTELYKLSLEEDTIVDTRTVKACEAELKAKELNHKKVVETLKSAGDLALGAGKLVGAVLMWRAGLKFEQTGSISSSLVKNLIDFNPLKK